MTCIVGYIENGIVYIGADSAGVAGDFIVTRRDPKVFVNDEFIIGFTSSFRMGQLIQNKWEPPRNITGKDIFCFIVTDVVDSLRELYTRNGFNKNENGVDSAGVILIGYKSRLFKIESDYQVGEIYENFNACGSGEAYALASLYTNSSNNSLSAIEKIRQALQTAEHFCNGVRGPFNILGI